MLIWEVFTEEIAFQRDVETTDYLFINILHYNHELYIPLAFIHFNTHLGLR